VTHKLLLADDSVTIQRVVELTFSGEDVQVVTVGDGEQAIARIPIELPDIVLADIGMPKRSGYDVAAFVKGRADLSHIPVLLLAGAFEPVDESRAQQVHCDGVLVKPFEPQQVISRVRDLIESSRSAMARPQPVAAAAAFADQHVRNRDTVAHTGRPAVVSPESKGDVLESRDRNVEPKLDDYFDRLDAAFAELGSEADRDKRSHSDMRDDYDGRDVPTLESLLAVSSGMAPDELPLPEPPVPVELAGYEPVMQHASARTPGAVKESPQPMEGRNLVADMFAALFAAEQGEAVAPAAPHQAPSPPSGPATVTDSLVDEVTRRVVERLAPDVANELVAQIVSEVAERLIREEISRIKAAASARL
jgi:CheY-like chemotaxis protein